MYVLNVLLRMDGYTGSMTRVASSQPTRSLFLSQLVDTFRIFKQNIKASYGREEILVHVWMGIVLLTALICFALNALFFHFTTYPIYLSMITVWPAVFFIWWLIGHTHRRHWPRFGLMATTFAQVGFAFIIFVIAWAGFADTPFVIIDYHLQQWDLLLGFNQIAFMNWVHQFPALVNLLSFCYFTWQYQIVLAPLFLALLNRSQEINHYFIASAISFICCLMIYYFFPTIAPPGIMHSPLFTQDQYDLVTRYYEVHESLPISVFDGGIIAFPSGHVLFSTLVLFSLRKVKWAFYPMAVNNFFLIIGTMALGYHYLADVIASLIIVTAVLTGMHYYFKDNQSRAIKNS